MEEAKVKIVIDGSKAAESVGSLKKQLREAQADVQALSDKFGATSKQAVEAAKRAADLKDRIGDAKALTDAFNPDRKFQAFGAALQGVTGGFAAVQGALGLVGVKSDEVEKTLLKVQSAMALSQGINSILEARDSFKNLGTFIKSTTIFQKANNAATVAATAIQRAFGVSVAGTGVAFKALRAAIITTGIGALIVGVGLLVSKIMDWTSSTDSNKAAQDRLNRALEDQERLFAKQQQSLQRQRQIAVLRAQIAGKSADEIFAINQDFNSRDLKAAQDNQAALTKKLQEYEQYRAKLKKSFNNASSEEEDKQYNDLKQKVEKANEEISSLEFSNQVDVLNEQKRVNEQSAAASKIALDKRKQAVQERIKAEEEANERLRQLRELRASSILDLKEQISSIDEFVKGREQTLRTEQERTISSLDKRVQEQVTQSLGERISLTNELLLDQQTKELAAIEAEYQKKFQIIKGNEAAELALREDSERLKTEVKLKYENQRIDIAKTALSNIANIVGKETAAGKAVAIASATIDTYQAANKALKADYGVFGPAAQVARFIAVATTIAAGIKNVKEIAKAKVPGGGPSASVPAGLSSVSNAPISPQLPQAQLTQLDQGTINRLGSATNRAYVVESDITNNQERIRRINRAARLN